MQSEFVIATIAVGSAWWYPVFPESQFRYVLRDLWKFNTTFWSIELDLQIERNLTAAGYLLSKKVWG